MLGVDAWRAGVSALLLLDVTHGFVPHGAPAIRSASTTWGMRSNGAHNKWTRAAMPVAGRSGLQMHQVTLEHDGKTTVLEVDEYTTILDAALDADVDLPHDCKLGVCLTCPSKVISGTVEQPDGTLEDSVVSQGYALTCCSFAKSDATIKCVDEDELVGAQFSDRQTT